MVTFQNKNDEFVAITGRAEVVRDPQKVSEMWREHFKAWFPQGQNDPNLVLIGVTPVQGEYWDNSGGNKVSYAMEALRAYMSGTRPNIKEGSQHGKLSL